MCSRILRLQIKILGQTTTIKNAEVSKLTTTYKIIKAFSLSKIHPPCNHKNVHGLDCLDFVYYLWAGPVRIARSANSQTTRILAKCDCFRPWKKKRLARMLQGQFVRRWARRECVCCAAAMFVAKSPVASFKKKKVAGCRSVSADKRTAHVTGSRLIWSV